MGLYRDYRVCIGAIFGRMENKMETTLYLRVVGFLSLIGGVGG